ncbi:MAG: hypothetical protein JWQ43_4081 [Glaciihabitans sp.]|nr:hypothetical protein [Glaciihabitans sp.]
MKHTAHELSDTLTALVAAVEGVSGVYPAQPAIAVGIASVANVVGGLAGREPAAITPPRVTLSTVNTVNTVATAAEPPPGEPALVVEVRIGVDSIDSAAEVARRVHNTIARHLDEALSQNSDSELPGTVNEIRVKVARIG